MKRFIYLLALFIIPIIGCLTLMEIIVSRIPNSYRYKYNYVTEKGHSIEALAIGHSQLYDDFMPDLFFLSAFNLSNSAQDYTDNYYILRELLPYMPNLKVVIIPIGYLNVADISFKDELSERSCYYHKYMKVDYDGRLPLKYWFECFNPKKAGKKIVSYYFLHSDMVGCDSLGRRSTHNLRDMSEELGNGNLFKIYTLKQNNYEELRIGYEESLLRTIRLLSDNDIAIVLVSPPYFWDKYKDINRVQLEYEKRFIAHLCEDYPQIHYVDLEDKKRFDENDFYDESHLSKVGAQKFTVMVGESIKGVIEY